MTAELNELRAKRSALARQHAERVRALGDEIKAVTRAYDRELVWLGREIAKLEELEETPIEPPQPKTRRRAVVAPRITVDDGFTPEEVEHYYELLARKS